MDGARLRQLRRQRGLSSAELAGQAGIGMCTLTRLDASRTMSCRTRTLARLAAALGQPSAALTVDPHPVMPSAESRVPRRVLAQSCGTCETRPG